MQLNELKELENEWNATNHPEERHTIYTIAAQRCQDSGKRLMNKNGKWEAIPKS